MRGRTLPAVLATLMVAGLFPTVRSWGAESLPDGRFGTRTAPILLLSRPDVRADLSLDAKQTAEAEQVMAALHAKAAALKGKEGGEVKAARNRIDAEGQRWLKAHLTEPQYSRLHQIDLQWEGPSALISRPVLTSRLQLTKPQIEALRNAVGRRNRERDPAKHDHAIEANLERMSQAILTEPQQEQWKQLLGEPFKLRVAEGPANPVR